jgi:hypothetical protein
MLSPITWFSPGSLARSPVHRRFLATNPQSPLRDLCAMLSPIHLVLARELSPFTEDFGHLSESPSVTSVTSVRCFPHSRGFSPGSLTRSPKIFWPPIRIPFCDLRDLCAMLSPFAWVLARELNPFTEDFWPPIRIPFCDLRDLCAMLSPFAWFSLRSSGRSPTIFWPQSQSPLCDLRDLCAMLYSRGSHTYGVVAANSFPPCEPWTFTV